MGKVKMSEIFLRERLCKVMEEIKQLNIERIDKDIEDVKNYIDINALFASDRHVGINAKLIRKQNELKLISVCLFEGIEYLTEKLIPELKENAPKDFVEEIETLANTLVSMAKVEIDDETGDAN